MYEVTIQYKNSKILDNTIKFDDQEGLEYFLKILNKETIKTIYVDNEVYYKTKPKFNLFALFIIIILMLSITAGSLYIVDNIGKFSTTYRYHNIARIDVND